MSSKWAAEKKSSKWAAEKMSSGISQSAHVSNEHCSAHFRISNILMRNEMFGLKNESYLFLRICWPSGGCSQHISIVRISSLREQIGIHASLLLLWEQRPKVGAVKEVLLASLEPLCPKTFPPLFSLPCVPVTCLEKDSLRHAGSLTEFSCIQEKKIWARQPLKSWGKNLLGHPSWSYLWSTHPGVRSR